MGGIERIIGSKSLLSMAEVLMIQPEKELTIRQLALEAGIPYSVAHGNVQKLSAEGFLNVRTEGNRTIIRVNRSHPLFPRIENMFKEEKREKKQFLKLKGREAALVIHHNADPDALGSAVALARGLAQLGVKTRVVAPGGLNRQSKSVLTKYPYPVEKELKREPTVIVLDTSSPEQLEGLEIPRDRRLIVLDHHIKGRLAKRADQPIIDKTAHSTSIIVYELLKARGVRITAEIAFFLLVGIVADTAFLRLADRRDLLAIAELMKLASLEDVYAALSVPVDFSERIARAKGMERAEVYTIDETLVAFSRIGSFESAVARTLVASYADIAIVENVGKKSVRISGRMRRHLADKLNLAEVFTRIEKLIEGGAGGHATAASANGKNPHRMKEVRKALLVEIEKRLGQKAKKIKE